MNEDFRTLTKVVHGQGKLTIVVAVLIDSSKWFSVEPLPDDFWEITVKSEIAESLDLLIELLG